MAMLWGHQERLARKDSRAFGRRVTTRHGPGRVICDGLTPAEVAARLRHLPGLVWFDTAGNLPSSHRPPVSVVAARPVRVQRGSLWRDGDRAQLVAAWAAGGGAVAAADRGHPWGGLCGWVDYDGAFVFGVYPEMLVYSHDAETWVERGGLSRELKPAADEPVSLSEFRPLGGREPFVAAVRRAQEWIAAGDIYQVNLAQCFEAEVAGGSLFPLYEVLRGCSPAPMAAWMSLAGREVLCSSPELFLRMSGQAIETRPIKGTRPRHAEPEEDSRLACELQTSAKEIAELVMITDLLRNDLGQVCEFGSVRVDDMLRLERLEQVQHLVSTVSGELRAGVGHVEALAACFPGGSITGAPKKRAREIIGVLEAVPRGLYCGALGYFGFHGESQFNLVIRSLVREGPRVTCHVGAGIVADSVPEQEYEETMHKAAGIWLAVDRWRAGAGAPVSNTGTRVERITAIRPEEG